MPDTNAPLELSSDQRLIVGKSALAMKLVAIVLLIVAATGIAAGVVTLVNGSLSGLLGIVEGLITCLLGLIMLSSSADVRYMVETTYPSIHLGNALRSLTTFFKAQFLLALLLIAIAVIRLFVG